MLDFIRKGASSWMIKFLLGAIVIVFIFWGVGSFRSQRMDVVAKVNGEKIMAETYQHEYRKAMEQYSKMFGGSIPENLMKQLNIKQQVLDSLINKVLIAQKAAEMGIRVSNQEVQQAILGIPAFKVNGVFDKRAYEAALRNARLSPAGFEAQVRESLLMEELRAILQAGLTVPEAEAREHYLYENQEIDISFIKVDSSECESDVKYTDQDLEEWFSSHSEQYRTEPEIQLSYLLFDISKLKKEVKISDGEVSDWYESHVQDYHEAEQRRARHILLKIPRDASDQEVQAKKKQIDEIRARIENGASFAEVAKEVSEDPGSGKNGGDLGFFSRKSMVKPFADTVFSMKKGEISQPVRTQFGWHIILLEEIRPERTRPMEEVREQIREKLALQKARKMAWDRANAAYDEIIQMGSLEDYVKTAGAELETTSLFVILLGYVESAVIFVVTFDFVRRRIQKEQAISKHSHPSDWFFVIWLFLMGLTAFAVRLFIDMDLLENNIWIYVLHLIILVQWALIIVPFGKWTHFLYRSFAMYFHRIRELAA